MDVPLLSYDGHDEQQLTVGPTVGNTTMNGRRIVL